MEKSSSIAARLDDDNGSWNVSWNRVAMVVASGIADADHGALADGCHLLSMTRFFGFGLR